MNLTLEYVHIHDVQFGPQTEVRDHVLYVDKADLLSFIADPLFTSIDVDFARPGESVRIIPVKDVIEPRIKMSEKGGAFPGYFGRFEECGEGITKVLQGCTVVTTGSIVGFQEGIIDMSGPGAEYVYFAKKNNVVIISEVKEGVHPTEHEKAVRVMGLKAAYYLSRCTKEAPVDKRESFSLPAPEKKLPKVALVSMIMAQGLIHDNYLYGIDAKRLHPTFIHPNEFFDGAIVNGTCVVAGNKNTTYDYQNNPVAKEMLKRHGKELEFVGCIVVPTYTVLKDKERCSSSAVNMARLLDVDGVVITQEGGGNPEADQMKMIKGCESNGIKTVGMVMAIGGVEGISDTASEADAMVNVGSDELNLLLPPMDKVLGHPEQVKVLSGASDTSLREDGSIYCNIFTLMCSCNQLGTDKRSSRVY